VKDTKRALAISVDGNGRFCYLDPYHGAMLAVAGGLTQRRVRGGEPIGATNNLNFGNPERPEIMWQIGEAVRGIGDACRALARRSPAATSASTTKPKGARFFRRRSLASSASSKMHRRR
jgi:phosphoribosylformylglycinamidine synthase